MKDNTIQETISAAKTAFLQGDPRTALDHLRSALWDEPNHSESLGLAADILGQSDDVLSLTQMNDNPTWADAALRALGLSQAHQFTEAFIIILDIVTNYSTPHMAWVKTWIDTHPVMIIQLLESGQEWNDAVNSFFSKIYKGIDKDDSDYPNAEALSYVLGKVDQSYSEISPITLHYAKSLRLTKQFDKALELAKSYREKNAKLSWLMEAWVGRDMRNTAAAVICYEKVVEIDREDFSPFLDAADMLLHDGEFTKARELYARVPQSTSEYDWALPSLLAATYFETGDQNIVTELRNLTHGNQERKQQLLDDLEAFQSVQYLPKDLTAEQVLNIYNQLKDNPANTTPDTPAKMTVNLSTLESPSVSLCLKNAMSSLGEHVEFVIDVKEDTQPDLRLPLNRALGEGEDEFAAQYTLWKYEGNKAVPALPEPDMQTSQMIAGVAMSPMDISQWKVMTGGMATVLAGKEDQILATMVNIPQSAIPQENPNWWVYKVQLVAGMMLENIDSGWQGSKRREALLAVAHNPVDWTINAVLPILENIFYAEPSAQAEILQTFEKLEKRIPKGDGYVAYRHALYACWFRIALATQSGDQGRLWKNAQGAIERPFFVD